MVLRSKTSYAMSGAEANVRVNIAANRSRNDWSTVYRKFSLISHRFSLKYSTVKSTKNPAIVFFLIYISNLNKIMISNMNMYLNARTYVIGSERDSPR